MPVQCTVGLMPRDETRLARQSALMAKDDSELLSVAGYADFMATFHPRVQRQHLR
jgi:hypothetical protein